MYEGLICRLREEKPTRRLALTAADELENLSDKYERLYESYERLSKRMDDAIDLFRLASAKNAVWIPHPETPEEEKHD